MEAFGDQAHQADKALHGKASLAGLFMHVREGRTSKDQ